MNLQVAFTKALGVDKLRKFMVDLGLTVAALLSLRGRGVHQPMSTMQQPISSDEYNVVAE